MGGVCRRRQENIILDNFQWSGTPLGSEELQRAIVAERVGAALLNRTLVVPGTLLQVMMEAMAKVAMQALTHNLLCCALTPYISKPLEGLRRPIPQRLTPVTLSSHPPSH